MSRRGSTLAAIEGSEQYTLAQLPGLFQDEAADLVRALHHFLELRFVKCKCPPKQGEKSGPGMSVIHGHADAYKLIETAGLCFDLRKLCTSSEPDGEAEALKAILSVAANSGVVFDVRAGRAPLLDQLETLRVRLSDAAKTYPYNERWFVAKEGIGERSVVSGTVIMKDLFTVPELRRDLEYILYVFNHLILKIVNEAVVEGMGSMMSMHGDKLRGCLRQELTEIEALVHYNFPPLSHPGTEAIIREALNHRFNGGDWHFTQTYRPQATLYSSRSKVLRRHDNAASKHSFLA